MYRFTDNGDRKVALRYDQTVRWARVVAQYQNELPRFQKDNQIQLSGAPRTPERPYRDFAG